MAKGQWEFQIFGKGSKRAADEIWMARYLLERVCEKYGIDVEYHCKPLGDTDWNGSGMHCNFSTKYMREVGGKAYFEALMAQFAKNWKEHIDVYGPDNDKRLTASTKRLRGTSSPTALPTVAPRSAFRIPSSRTTIAVTWKIAVRTRKATPTRSHRAFSDDREVPLPASAAA